MDYLITNLIDETINQLRDLSIWTVLIFTYFGTAIAQYAGKYAALRENDKALEPIANAFYTGAMHGLSETFDRSDMMGLALAQDVADALFTAKKHRRSVWA